MQRNNGIGSGPVIAAEGRDTNSPEWINHEYGISVRVYKIPSFIDFEASGLGPRSYPIEVAWSGADGGVEECWLIRPEATYGWPLEEAWEVSAERVHGIPFEDLLRHGRTADWIAARMNAQLAGRTVYADGGAYDKVWCEQLFTAAGLEMAFRIDDYWELLLTLLPPARTRRFGWQAALQEAAWKRVSGRRHRADTDVRYLVALYRLATGN